ncbi:MAG: 4Fe-4S binding protein [Chloroflexota bacterium]
MTIDMEKCDGCGECVSACPASIFEMIQEDSRQPKARVVETARKRLSLLCPGYTSCRSNHNGNCRTVCRGDAISLSW